MKKIAGLSILGFVPGFLLFIFLLLGYGTVFAIMGWGVGIIVGIVAFSILTRHPLIQLMQGEGLLALTYDSTGVIEPFIVKVLPPFIRGRVNSLGKDANSIFDRETIFYTRPPKEGTLQYNGAFKDEKSDENFDVYNLKVPKGKEGNITFSFMQYPTLIYNKNIGAFLTKDALSKMETEGIIRHLVLYLKVKTEELTSIMRDFARYVIEMTKPKSSWLAGKGRILMWVVFGIIIVVMVTLFAPSILNAIGPAAQQITGSIGGAAGTIQRVGG